MAGPKYTRRTSRTYPDPEGSGGYGVEVTAWTDDAWNRAQEANRRYQADLEWQRVHPYLARMRNFGRNALNSVGNFVNDEILLNKGNVRVKNAQAHPEVMNAIQSGGNIAGGMVALPFALGAAAETAPVWGPWAMQGLRALATPKGMLVADAATTAGFTANQWMPWLFGTGAATIAGGQYIAENGVPSISLPLFGSRSFTAAQSAPTDSVSTANPPVAPADTTGTVAPGTAPAPRPEGNDSTSQRRPSFRERLGDRIAGRKPASGGSQPPKNGWQLVSRYLWETKNNNLGPNNWGLRNLGRVVLYGGEPTRKFLGNAARDWFLGTDSIPTQQPAGLTTTANPSVTNPTDTLPAVSNLLLPDSTVVNANSDWEEWLKSRGTE